MIHVNKVSVSDMIHVKTVSELWPIIQTEPDLASKDDQTV